VRGPYINGPVERFYYTVLDEFFRSAFRITFYSTLDAFGRISTPA
jgi:hypothetical protein